MKSSVRSGVAPPSAEVVTSASVKRYPAPFPEALRTTVSIAPSEALFSISHWLEPSSAISPAFAPKLVKSSVRKRLTGMNEVVMNLRASAAEMEYIYFHLYPSAVVSETPALVLILEGITVDCAP